MGLALAEEADRPVASRFITVDGTRLHYIDRGRGTPVVLLHGNGSMIGDFLSSGITACAEAGCRVVAFDRPGFGYSERPRGRRWGPFEQARLLLRAFALLGIERPIVVGHSWGTLVAVALALESGQDVAGLVLLSGYYYPVPRPRPNAASVSRSRLWTMSFGSGHAVCLASCTPGGGEKNLCALRRSRALQASIYSMADALRPSQMKAVEEEAAMLGEAARTSPPLPGAERSCSPYCGSDDRIVETEKHSVRLHRELATSTLRVVPGCGHMVHHAVPEEVMGAIVGMDEGRGSRAAPARRTVQASMPRHWLHIGEDAIESHHAARPLAAAHGTHAGYAVASAT